MGLLNSVTAVACPLPRTLEASDTYPYSDRCRHAARSIDLNADFFRAPRDLYSSGWQVKTKDLKSVGAFHHEGAQPVHSRRVALNELVVEHDGASEGISDGETEHGRQLFPCAD